ncbi:tetratricopeptide repeat protein [Tenacibaculum skagerrakense]|uniref:Tetratricopeptide repeat protein n=1 Tax=Tenacibaculum skagerrakense TaxID=186571 RepID=A0A4V2SMQ6_9FLAO|nr:cell surface protein [Tenacibaculum skagerrakense]TCP28256.1 tetratricopeptide repeat protein [Tenacibaculum skagerrakense]
MKLKNIIYSISVFTLLSCSNNEANNSITNKEDYEAFLTESKSTEIQQVKKNLSFWKDKLEKSPTQYPYLSKIASINTNLFTITGNINYLKEAEKKLLQVNEKAFSVGNLRALARNYISQHKFKDALNVLKKVEKNGEELVATQKMLFDVHLELGQNDEAKHYLDQIEKYADFDYFIRAGKWSDHKGDLSSAITFLEKALSIAKFKNNKDLLVWSYTNLADFYGHNNEIKKSYQYYLKSLAIQPHNSYAMKGISWIVYSYENNPDEALRILEKIKEQNASPDYSLFIAEIYEYKNDEEMKTKYLNSFLSQTENKSYGVMYNSHIAKVILDEFDEQTKAYNIILQEIENRATAESYDLLAWAAFKNGELKKSLSIANEHIVGKSFEPSILYHVAEIYKANGLLDEASKIKVELLECGYELGPVTFNKIERL